MHLCWVFVVILIRALYSSFALLLPALFQLPPRHRQGLGPAPPAVRGFALSIHRHAIRSCLDFFNVFNTLLVFVLPLTRALQRFFALLLQTLPPRQQHRLGPAPPAVRGFALPPRALSARRHAIRNLVPVFLLHAHHRKAGPARIRTHRSERVPGLWLPIYFARKGSAALSDAVDGAGCAEKVQGRPDGFDTFARGNHEYIRAAAARTDDAVADVGTAAMAIGGAGCAECCRGGARRGRDDLAA